MEFSEASLRSLVVYDYFGILVLLVIILLLSFLWNVSRTRKCYKDIPTLHNLVFKGIYALITKPKHHTLARVIFQITDDVTKEHEKEGMMFIWSFRRVLLIFGEESIKTFASDEDFAVKSSEYDVVKDTLGEGLLTSNVETWKKDRKLLNPAFHTRVLKNKISILNENANIWMKKLAKIDDEPTVDLVSSLTSCVFHNLCETILGVNMKETISDEEIEEMYMVSKELCKYMTMTWLFPARIVTLFKFFTPFGWKFRKLNAKFRKFVQKIMLRMKELFLCKSSDSEEDPIRYEKSLSSILLEPYLKDHAYTSKYIEDHFITFIAAGMDTTIHTMMWCLILLGLNKDIQQKASEEVQSVTKEYITYEDLCQLEYLECIIKETLRLYPTVPFIARQIKKDKQCGKYKVPKDTVILFHFYRLHRNAEIYPDPDTFDPDRFHPSNASGRSKWCHLSFSEGYRSCIGKKFAMMEMKVMLAYILRNYEITSLDRREDVDFNWEYLLVPSKPLRLRLTPRKLLSVTSSKIEE